MDYTAADIEKSWRKIEYVSKKEGLREGISRGRESNFQGSFDIGFKEGFRNGFLLGKYTGSLIAHRKQHVEEAENGVLPEKIGHGNCRLCKDEQLLQEDIPLIIKKQNEFCNEKMNSLNSDFIPKMYLHNQDNDHT